MQEIQYDYIIIGSGFGGSVSALSVIPNKVHNFGKNGKSLVKYELNGLVGILNSSGKEVEFNMK